VLENRMFWESLTAASGFRHAVVWPIGRSRLAHRGAEHAAMRAVALHSD